VAYKAVPAHSQTVEQRGVEEPWVHGLSMLCVVCQATGASSPLVIHIYDIALPVMWYQLLDSEVLRWAQENMLCLFKL